MLLLLKKKQPTDLRNFQSTHIRQEENKLKQEEKGKSKQSK